MARPTVARPTVDELTLVQRYVERVRNRACQRGLALHLDNDVDAFVDFLGAQEATHGVSSIHDPAHSYITPDNFLWMRIDDGGTGVCCHAIRLVETDDLIAEVLTHRIFGNLAATLDFQDVELYPEAWQIDIAGRVVIGGGLWVHPGHRGRDYSALFRKLLRVVAIRHFRLDYYASFIRNTNSRKAWVLGSYGSPNAIPLLHGYYPPYRRPLDVQLAYASRPEILSRIREELMRSDPSTRGSHRPAVLPQEERQAESTRAS
jgi:GNAT superfamily N-acetyltransferase